MFPKVNAGVPTLGIILTVCVAVRGPLQPAADAVIVEVPVHPAVNLTSPVRELIVLPAEILAALRE